MVSWPSHLSASKKPRPGAARVAAPTSRRHARGHGFVLRHASNAPDAPGDGNPKISRSFRKAWSKIPPPHRAPNFPRTGRNDDALSQRWRGCEYRYRALAETGKGEMNDRVTARGCYQGCNRPI